MNGFLARIPQWLGLRPWIIFLLLLMVYLVGFGALGVLIPAIEPSANAQLILGNLTNVASALGASIAAATGTVGLKEVRVHHAKQHLFREQMRAHLDLPHPKEQS